MTDQFRSRGPELLIDLVDKTTEVLQQQAGLAPETARLCAEAVASRMRMEWGGQQVYFPKGAAADISSRDVQLYREFNGHNHEHLARKYNMSVQWVYQRIKAVQASEIARRQADLFTD